MAESETSQNGAIGMPHPSFAQEILPCGIHLDSGTGLPSSGWNAWKIARCSAVVTTGADSGPGSLRDTIASATSGATIEFAKNVHKITLTTSELEITQNLDIEGPGTNKLTISGNDSSRVFDISPDTTVTIAGLTITPAWPTAVHPFPPAAGAGS